MREMHLFAGAGGGILAGQILGHRPVCAVEILPYPREVLRARQIDGSLPIFSIFEDICTFDGNVWRDRVDIVAGGFPCQDISAAGTRKGLAGERSGLWFEMARVVGEVGPEYVFVENSERLVNNGLDRVLGTLADLGFDAEWCVLSAEACGAPHLRKRTWILARSDTNGRRLQGLRKQEHGHVESSPRDLADRLRAPGWWNRPPAADTGRPVLAQRQGEKAQRPQPAAGGGGGAGWWAVEPDICRMVDELAPVVDRRQRLHALGNGQVPIVAATAFSILMERLHR